MTRRSPSAPIAEQLTASGDVLFRWRSYMPLVLLPIFVLSLFTEPAPTSFGWELSCFAVAMAGLGLRALVIGTAPEGTSARGTRRPTADSLNVSGAYSIVRHPLYLANTAIALGCSLLSGTWFLPLIVALLSFIYHERIAAREEEFLHGKFGEAFERWARDVPALIPRLSGYRRAGAFQRQKAAVQECYGLFAIGTAFLVLDTIEDSVRARGFHVDSRWLTVFVATAVPFIIAIAWKKWGQRHGSPARF